MKKRVREIRYLIFLYVLVIIFLAIPLYTLGWLFILR